jgi:Pyruvate/2-oxoacid:ferredoxin oxidoreductase delta subunit
MSEKQTNWTVDHDKTKCALCVVCARNCPTEALKRVQEGDNLALYFNASLCDGCNGEAICQRNCPESAIQCVKADSISIETGYALLFQSEMAQCQYCDEYFAPVRRLDVISKKITNGREISRDLCPVCRRTRLVVDYIEKNRLPGSPAEFRSGKDIIRRAKKRMEEEER